MVGIFAGGSVLMSLQIGKTYLWFGAPWVMFISWGLYFMAGAKVSRLHKYFWGLLGGVVFGVLTLWAYPYLTQVFGDVFGLPATVFLAATLIVLLELTDWFELAPAYFFNYAGYFAYVFGGAAQDATASIYTQAIYFFILSLIGLLLGWITATLKTIIFNVEKVPLESRGTVFDKERV